MIDSSATIVRTESSATAARRRKLIVFSDDWGRHPSSCQHLVRPLLARLDVTWVNTIGMRPPRWNWETVRRGIQKLGDWRPGRHPSPRDNGLSPRVVNPVMWPSFRSRWGKYVNRKALGRAVRKAIGDSKEPATILTTIPVIADLINEMPEAYCVYYCVDDFSTWPGLDGLTLSRMEQQLVDYANCIVTAGENLTRRIRRLGRESAVLTHGVDLDFWRVPAEEAESPTILREIPRPIVMFWGLIDRRLDVDYLAVLGDSLTAGTIVLVGPEQDPDPRLDTIANLRRIGPVRFAELPRLAAQADLLIMPYANVAVTQSMQPLKLKEYLATGKPVVVRQLPATHDWNDCLDAVEHPAEFAAAACERLRGGLPASQLEARRRLSAEGWSEKSDRLERILFPDPPT